MKRDPTCFGSVPGCGYFNDEEVRQTADRNAAKAGNESVPKPEQIGIEEGGK